MKKRVLSLFLVLVMCLSILGGKDIAFANVSSETLDSGVIVNPLYEDVYSEDEKQALIEAHLDLVEENEAPARNRAAAKSTVYSNIRLAADYLRAQMVARNTSITIVANYDSKVMNARDSAEWIALTAMEYFEDCTGQEGDALLAGFETINWNGSFTSTQLSLTYTVAYRTTAAEEAELTAAVNTVLDSLDLQGKSDYQKARAIHDYICDNVDYDYDHYYDYIYDGVYYAPMFTSYAALCDGTAVCQGYALLFYRMCKDAGLSVRYISGLGNGGAHGWNIVKIGDRYYNVDTTWDGQDEETYLTYFLKNEVDFEGHQRSSEYDSKEFHMIFPMGGDSWEDYGLFTGGLNYTNLSESTYTTLADGTVNNQANGKPKVLVFGRTECYYTQNTIYNLSQEDFSDIDLIYVDAVYTDTKEMVTALYETYGTASDDITYTYNLNGTNLWDYVGLLMGEDVDRITFPFIVYIDGNNKIQDYDNAGVFSAKKIRDTIDQYTTDKESFALSLDTTTLKINESIRLYAKVFGASKNAQFFTWTSTNPAVAKVDENGKVTAVGEGTATIKCAANDDVFAMCQVKVSGTGVAEILPSSITMEASSKQVFVGDTFTMKTTLYPANTTYKEILWISSNPEVASVDANGKVTAKAIGVAEITAVVASNTKLVATCIITVNAQVKYNIKFNANGGSGTMSTLTNRKYGTSYALPANKFTRKGYTFNGWNTRADGKGTAYKNKASVKNLTTTNGKTVTLYAQWKKVKYTITYKLNGGKNNKGNKTSYYVTTSTFKLKNPTRKGYTFKGWYKDSKFKNKATQITKGSTGNVTLYAKWEKTKYKITYVLNKGKNNKSNKTSYNITTSTFKLKNPTRKGYVFKGWYSDAKFKKKVTKIAKGSTGNIKLYAKWVKKK